MVGINRYRRGWDEAGKEDWRDSGGGKEDNDMPGPPASTLAGENSAHSLWNESAASQTIDITLRL
jgi:hypothetical protein